jgi:hypothetical protein
MAKKILFIEKMNFLGFLYYLFNFWRIKEVIFLSENKIFSLPRLKSLLIWNNNKMKRLQFKDFPGSYFLVGKEGSINSIEKFYNAHKEENVIIDFLMKFKNNFAVEIALQKILLRDYVVGRVKTFVFLKKIIEQKDEKIIFIPEDNIDFLLYLSFNPKSLNQGYTVPKTIIYVNIFKEFVQKFSLIFYATGLIGFLLRRGFSYRKRTSIIKYDIGFDIYDNGINFDNLYHDTFIYGKGVFQPKKVFHVVRNSLKDKKTKDYFSKKQYPYVEFGKVSMSVNYFVKRIIIDFYLNALITAIKIFFFNSQQTVFIKPSIKVVYFTLANEHGLKTVGFDHGDVCVIDYPRSHLYFDYYCVWGGFTSEIIYRRALSHARKVGKRVEVIGAGIYGMDDSYKAIKENKIPRKYKDVAQQYKIILVFLSSWHPEENITKEHHIQFLHAVSSLTKRYEDIYIVVKPKMDCDNFVKDPEFKAVMPKDRVIIDCTTGTYNLFPLGDLILTIGVSTIGLEGLMAKKKVVYYNINMLGEYHPYSRYDNSLVANSLEEFNKNVDRALKGDYINEKTWRKIIKMHGFRFDGNVRDRFRKVVFEALNAVNSGGLSEGL